MLEMGVHFVLHIEDDMLGNTDIDVAFQDADQLRGNHCPEGHQKQLDQQRQIPSDQSLVHNAPCNDGGQQSQQSGGHNGGKHQDKLFPIGTQIGKNAFQELWSRRRAILFFFLGQKPSGLTAMVAPGHQVSSPGSKAGRQFCDWII